ncbi:hypothetical protein J6590_015579 [Homalodisca vitripennis]|nr:hypothetical protein J6590_015579 [Homalodisca vitripennis]
MPPMTRYRYLLSIDDGLLFIDNDVIDLASNLITSLTSIRATHGNTPTELTHPPGYLDQLNNLSKFNRELDQELDSLRINLSKVESGANILISVIRTNRLNVLKYDTELINVKNVLASRKTTFEKESLDREVSCDIDRLKEQIDKCRSVGDRGDLRLEMTFCLNSSPPSPVHQEGPSAFILPVSRPHTSSLALSANDSLVSSQEFDNVLLLDDSHLRYAKKTNVPMVTIFLISVLVSRDISYKALYNFNDQPELMCNNFGVEYVDTNT